MIKNNFYNHVKEAYLNNYSIDELVDLLGIGRAKKGMFLGDLVEGELEIGQVSSLLDSIQHASVIVEEIIQEYNALKSEIMKL